MTASHGRVWWRQRLTRPAAGLAQRIVVVTDADGTLAEPGAQSVEVQAALDFLAARAFRSSSIRAARDRKWSGCIRRSRFARRS